MEMEIELINECLSNGIELIGLRTHSKASEKYADVKFTFSNGFVWEGSIPYYYRRTGLFIETVPELCHYLTSIKAFFSEATITEFIATEKERWDLELSGKTVTKTFFDVLLNLQWNSVENDLPNNPNWARRIQDIKEFGYTVATRTNMIVENGAMTGTHIMLLPIPKGGVTGYETISISFKKRIIRALNAINVFDLSSANKHGLIPDHKFPEIRWDELTRQENESLSDEEIRSKFQLLDNQRNQQKREICRKCFQSNKRGIVFGIDYFYEGSINWPEEIPKVGASAERGCVGCAWYDMAKWRASLNDLVRTIK